MTAIADLLSSPPIAALGWTLFHFLWQGILAFGMIALLLVALRTASARVRYLVLCGGLALMALCPPATFGWIITSFDSTSVEPPFRTARVTPAGEPLIVDRALPESTTAAADHTEIPALEPTPAAAPDGRADTTGFLPFSPAVSWRNRLFASVEPVLPWLVGGWLLGVFALSMRLLAAWQRVRRLRFTSVTSGPPLWQERLVQLAARLRISRPVRLVESALVEVPTVIGWLKPVILLPVSALTGLDARQIEALLAHELAHVRRHDYLVNLLQNVLETLLFYHPVVWWVSRWIRDEREHCCDDVAVALCGDGMTYARALATMEELRTMPALSVAANGGTLLRRIQRIVSKSNPPSRKRREALAPSGFAVAAVGGLFLAAGLTAMVGGRIGVALQAEDETAPSKEKDGRPQDADASGALQALIEKVRQQEDRFRQFAATTWISHDFRPPDPRSTSSGNDDRDPLVNISARGRQIVDGERFRFVGESITTRLHGPESRGKQESVCNGAETLSIEGGCATKYPGHAEPPAMLPPHTWGMLHSGVSFPLSVYLTGTEAFKSHPKVGRHPHEAGSTTEFSKAEAAIVDEAVVDGLDCTIVLVKRWYRTSDGPIHQYLWLARDRNYHVAQSRTAFTHDGQELPREESRVRAWKQLADGVWLPEVVEVVNISSTAVIDKPAMNLLSRLTLERAEWKPQVTAKTFELPATPAEFPKFAVDAKHRLVESPHQPAPIPGPPSTTLDAILARLAEEEQKYDPCEIIAVNRYEFLNSSMSEGHRSNNTRQRSVLVGTHRYREDVQTTGLFNGLERSRIDRIADDGQIRRSYSKSDSGKGPEAVSASAGIRLNDTSAPVSLDRPHTLIFRDSRESAYPLAEWLKSGWYDQRLRYAMTVEYVGDERIDDLFCHKLKCDLKENFFHLWLARDRNLIPIRSESHESAWNATLPTSVSYAEDLRQIRPGLWCPHRVTDLAFQKMGRDGLVVNRLVLQWRHDVTVESVTLDPKVEERLFSDVIVPEGTKVHVSDRGQYLGEYTQPQTGRLDVPPKTLQQLRDKARGLLEQPAAEVEKPAARRPLARQRADTPTGKLLDRLEQQNAGLDAFRDPWLRTMKDIVELGPKATPELIEELDATDNDRMLRCLGFILRAIDDKRAVPALIRAIPKTLRKPGSDLGLNAYDADLFKFARKYELNPGESDTHYGFKRPVREICGALRKRTGQQFNEQQIFVMFLGRMPPECIKQREQYYDVAKTWAGWWEQNWERFVDDKAYSRVNLPPLVRSSPPRPGAIVETIGSRTGLLLESVFDPQAKQVFYDIDTDRYGELPDKWRNADDIRSQLDEILAWARQEGFDLMGTVYATGKDSPEVLALRGIGLETSELNPARWKKIRDIVTLDMLREEGPQVDGLLLRRDPKMPDKIIEPAAPASFLAVTAERTPVLLQVGVEVRDARQKPGTFFQGDPELNPTGTMKGRRFAVMYLDEPEDRP